MVLLVVLAALVLLVSVAGVAAAVRHDGYGTRPAPTSHPASHRDWGYDALSSTPPVSLRR